MVEESTMTDKERLEQIELIRAQGVCERQTKHDKAGLTSDYVLVFCVGSVPELNAKMFEVEQPIVKDANQ